MKQQTTKPKLWRYKSGKNKGKLRPSAKKYLSYKLKEYYKFNPRQKRKKQPAQIQKTLYPTQKPKLPTERIRRQIVENYRADYPPYYVSVRAMTLNPTIDEKGLILALIKGKKLFEETYGSILKKYNLDYKGLAKQKIGDKEDMILNDGGVYCEVFIAYSQNKRMILKTYKIL